MIAIIKATINVDAYVDDQSDLIPGMNDAYGHFGQVLMQDGASPHTTASTIEYLKQLFQMIGNSPVMNPIENLQIILKMKINELNPQSEDELYDALFKSPFKQKLNNEEGMNITRERSNSLVTQLIEKALNSDGNNSNGNKLYGGVNRWNLIRFYIKFNDLKIHNSLLKINARSINESIYYDFQIFELLNTSDQVQVLDLGIHEVQECIIFFQTAIDELCLCLNYIVSIIISWIISAIPSNVNHYFKQAEFIQFFYPTYNFIPNCYLVNA